MLPRSLRSVADVRAARTKEKVGHSGPFDFAQGRRDDREGSGPTLCLPAAGRVEKRKNPGANSAPGAPGKKASLSVLGTASSASLSGLENTTSAHFL